jgi:hypothetical protein
MRGYAASCCRVGGLIKPVLVEREQWELRPLFGGVGAFFWRWEKRYGRVEDVKGKDSGVIYRLSILFC